MAAKFVEYEPPTRLQRLRSTLALLGLIVLLGTLAAATLGAIVVAVVSLIDHALG
ncbi:MAG: hypothetical protein ACT4OV_04775 [Microthrixaceae bacterium]